MIKTMYVARTYGPSIKAVQVEHESAHYVMIVGVARRLAKRTESESIFDTYAEAYEHLQTEFERRVLAADKACAVTRANLDKLIADWAQA